LADLSSLRHQVFYPYLHLIRTRAAHPAFHPNGAQDVLLGNESLFTLVRISPDGEDKILCIHNVSDVEQPFSANLALFSFPHSGQVRDLINGATFPVDTSGDPNLRVAPYQVLWLVGEK